MSSPSAQITKASPFKTVVGLITYKRKNVLRKKMKIDELRVKLRNVYLAGNKCKSAEKENESEKKFKCILPENELTFAFYPTEFPQTLLTEEYVEHINQLIEILKSQISEGEMMPGVIYIIFEAGYGKVKVADLYTKNWIIEIISTLIYQEMSLIVSSVKRIPKCLYSTRISGEVLNDTTILTTIDRENKRISTSRWSVLSKRQTDTDFVAALEVDAINAQTVEALDRMIFFRGETIELEFEQAIGQDADD